MPVKTGNTQILIASNTSWSVYNFRLPLVLALIEKGWRVTVLSPRDEYTDRIVASGVTHRNLELETRGTNPLRELAAIRAIQRVYREIAPSVALQYTIKPVIYGSIAARRLHLPVINNITGLGTMFSGGLQRMIARTLYRFAFARADLVFFQNPDDRDTFLRGGMIRPERVRLLPGSGVDTQRFTPRPRGSGAFTFLLLGRLLRDKGVEDFVSAARIVMTGRSGVRFVLLGRHDPADPSYADPVLLRRAAMEGLVERIEHTDDVRPFIAAADCVVLPSYYREGVPRSLLEAASMARPLIAADCAGTREPVRNGVNGFLCRPRDPVDLAARMEAVLALPPNRLAMMGDASRRLAVERFDERVVIGAYLEAVERLAGRPGTTRP